MTKGKATRKPLHERMAEQLISMLEAGTPPWRRPWKSGPSLLPVNAKTGKRYEGINTLSLWMQGRDDPRWVTFKQAQSLGAQVRKGESGTPIMYWKTTERHPVRDDKGRPVRDEKTGETLHTTVSLERPRAFYAVVFNAEQIDGLPELPEPEAPAWDPNERVEVLLFGSGAQIVHGGNKAYYSPRKDSIRLPARGQFPDLQSYSATALHELGHWTGHPSRLDRDLSHPFGSEGYAREELRAEIGSAMLCAELGIAQGQDLGNHAAYVGHWVEVLKKDPTEILRAARDAQAIAKHVLGLERDRVNDLEAAAAADHTEPPQPTHASEGNVMTEPPTRIQRDYIDVPDSDGDEAKALGAMWDPRASSWFIPVGANRQALSKWPLKPLLERAVPPPSEVTNEQTRTTEAAEPGATQEQLEARPALAHVSGRLRHAAERENKVGNEGLRDELLALHRRAVLDPTIDQTGVVRVPPAERAAAAATLRAAASNAALVHGAPQDAVALERLMVQLRTDKEAPEASVLATQTGRDLWGTLTQTDVRQIDGPAGGEPRFRLGKALWATERDGRLDVDSDPDAKAASSLLCLARARFGEELTVTGSDDFKSRLVEAAAATGIRVRFSDPEIEARRIELGGAPYPVPELEGQLSGSPPRTGPESTSPDADTRPHRLSGFDPEGSRTYIDVDYRDRAEAKALGAKWDRKERSWYVPAGVDRQALRQWPDRDASRMEAKDDASNERHYLAVPYAERGEAKRAGARWDQSASSWFVEVKPGMDLTPLRRWEIDGRAEQEPAMDPRQEFTATLQSLGFVLRGPHPIMDGSWHMVPVEGAKKGEKPGSYKAHLDGRPAGFARNHRTDQELRWKAKGYTLTAEEQAQIRAQAAEKQRSKEAREEAEQEETASRVLGKIADLVPVTTPTPYMQAKGIGTHAGTYTDGWGTTFIPLTDVDGKVWSGQTITDKGVKRYETGARRPGTFHTVGGVEKLATARAIVVGEGYATAATVSELLDMPAVAALDCGSLLKVAEALHQRWPDKPIVVVGDDDRHLELRGETNRGRAKAEEAAKAVGGHIVFPTFAPGEQDRDPKAYSDFNDLAHRSALGRDGARGQLQHALTHALGLHSEVQRAPAARQRTHTAELAR